MFSFYCLCSFFCPIFINARYAYYRREWIPTCWSACLTDPAAAWDRRRYRFKITMGENLPTFCACLLLLVAAERCHAEKFTRCELHGLLKENGFPPDLISDCEYYVALFLHYFLYLYFANFLN